MSIQKMNKNTFKGAKMNKIEHIINRMLQAVKCQNERQLSLYLGVKQNVISGWKLRQSVPQKHLEKISQNMNISLDWLQNGQGTMKILEKKSIKEILEVWMRYENLETLEALAQFLNQKSETLQEWIQNDEIPEREIKRYKIKSLESFRGANKQYKTEIYSIKEKQFYGKEVFHHSALDAKSAAEWLLEKYDIAYYEVEEAKFVDLDNDNIALHVKYSIKYEHELSSLKNLIRDEIEKDLKP